MRKLELVGLREGLTKSELARRLRTDKRVIHSWLSGKTIARNASVERIKEFLKIVR
jgi:ribosome-binding protein aMBF1 (putative translation factor)